MIRTGPSIRIGHGYDVHAFDDGSSGIQQIVLGGTRIPYERSLIAHSDGDVALHALCDALLGAAALGDIGHHFPDHDAHYHNANSRELLKLVRAKLQAQGFQLANADLTIIAQAPKLAPYINTMRTNIASDLEAPLSVISVKATTTESLGFIGRKEGIAVHAVVMIESYTTS